MSIKSVIHEAMKAAMRAQQKETLATIRLIQSEIKKVEVDERIEVDDERMLVILDKMLKQRRESIAQFEAAKRDDLVAKESAEVTVIQGFLPAQLSNDEIASMIDEAIASTGATSVKDMGKVMGLLKPKLQGRADIAEVSKLIKNRFA